jgi:hypothetical protein
MAFLRGSSKSRPVTEEMYVTKEMYDQEREGKLAL